MNLKLVIYTFILFSCVGKTNYAQLPQENNRIRPGAHDISNYVSKLDGKSVGLVVNHTSLVGKRHLIDTLIDLGINITAVFSPEHGFRGTADNGELIADETDDAMGIKIISLYGNNKKPTKEQLEGIEIIVFDLQDVGVRFYTYISTLHYVLEAAAENNIPALVLDRPNPNGGTVDGPVLNKKFKSFVGMHTVPVVYGMTIGEYALMINGESWLNENMKVNLEVVPNKNYNRNTQYNLPVKPSPNLPNSISVLLYPSLCFFEGTCISVGRGTDRQFQHIGHPQLSSYKYHFIPLPNEGSKNPKHKGERCYGINLSDFNVEELTKNYELDLSYLLQMQNDCKNAEIEFFTRPDFFDLLAGSDQLRLNIEAGLSEEEIRSSWKKDLEEFKKIRAKYLIYD